MNTIDRRTFLDVVGALPTGVTIVTTLDADGRPHGLTVSAVCSVSAEPPMLLVCIDRRSRTLGVIRAAGAFGVSFLRGDSEAIGRRFSSPVHDRFAGVAWEAMRPGVPILVTDSVAHATCQTVQEIEAGDHVILIGLVLDGAPPAALSRPLTYFRRRYAPWPGEVTASEREPATVPAKALAVPGGRAGPRAVAVPGAVAAPRAAADPVPRG